MVRRGKNYKLMVDDDVAEGTITHPIGSQSEQKHKKTTQSLFVQYETRFRIFICRITFKLGQNTTREVSSFVQNVTASNSVRLC